MQVYAEGSPDSQGVELQLNLDLPVRGEAKSKDPCLSSSAVLKALS